MKMNPLAGKPAQPSMLVNVPRLVTAFYSNVPHPKLYEVPVGFKWFVEGLLNGSLGFGGEENAGASFVRMDGSVAQTIVSAVLAASSQ